MSNVAEKNILIAIIVAAMVLSLSSVAFAADPQYIYYENEDKEVVQADYKQIVDNLPGNTVLWDAIKAALESAIGAFRNVWVEDQKCPVIDYSKAVTDKLTYPEALADLSTYGTDRPDYVKMLVIDPDTGQAVEKRWLVSVGGLADIDVDYGTSLADVRGKLPTANNLVLTLSDGETSAADSVYWSPAEAVYWDEDDPNYIKPGAGTYVFKGELGMPECVINPDNLKAKIDVIVGEPNNVTLTVKDLSNNPLQGATVKVDKDITGTLTSVLDTPATWEKETDANGEVYFALSDGDYIYTASKAGYKNEEDTSFNVDGDDRTITAILAE